METWIQYLKDGYTNITPEMAHAMLDTMQRNRPLSEKKVKQYARDLENDNFGFCTDPICFDPDWHLINGQHRLTAIIRSGQEKSFYIKTHVPSDTTFDIGQPRNSAQELYTEPNL